MKIFAIILFLALPFFGEAQKLKVTYGVDKDGRTIAYQLLRDAFDVSAAYTTEGYWQSNQINYYVVSKKNGTYYKGTISIKRQGDSTWTKPIQKFKKVNSKKAQDLFKMLDKSGLWTLNVDSLNNQEAILLFDGRNYRFELIEGDNLKLIGAYMPDYFLEVLPQYKQRAVFIKVRNDFSTAYKKLN